MRIEDAHCHFFSRAFFDRLAREAGVTAADPVAAVTDRLGWQPPADPEQLADRWVAELDRHGVARTALIASVPGDESSVAAALARHPDRFVGYFMLDPTADDAGTRTRAALRDRGLRVVCLFPAMHRFRVNDDRVLQVCEEAAAVPGAAVFVHCGVLSIGVRKRLGLPSRFDLQLGQPLAVQTVASAFPTLSFIIPHFGAGLFREALMAADACPNICLDTSSSNGWIRYHPGLALTDVFRQALAVAGPDRLLFGTDSSFFPRGWQQAIRDEQAVVLDTLQVDASVRERIFGGNFARLFPVQQPAT